MPRQRAESGSEPVEARGGLVMKLADFSRAMHREPVAGFSRFTLDPLDARRVMPRCRHECCGGRAMTSALRCRDGLETLVMCTRHLLTIVSMAARLGVSAA